MRLQFVGAQKAEIVTINQPVGKAVGVINLEVKANLLKHLKNLTKY
jgi:hypothetical protein